MKKKAGVEQIITLRPTKKRTMDREREENSTRRDKWTIRAKKRSALKSGAPPVERIFFGCGVVLCRKNRRRTSELRLSGRTFFPFCCFSLFGGEKWRVEGFFFFFFVWMIRIGEKFDFSTLVIAFFWDSESFKNGDWRLVILYQW